MEAIKGDLHLSANEISPLLMQEIEGLGFQRDIFRNNVGCIDVAYHATYRGSIRVPNRELWDRVSRILMDDETFYGCLEEEVIRENEIDYFEFQGPATLDPKEHGSCLQFCSKPVPIGIHKACDIHLTVDRTTVSTEAIARLDTFGFVSFEKPTTNGLRKIYTVTCEHTADGLAIFDLLKSFLPHLGPMKGKIKVERTSRFLRKPEAADYLPILDRHASSSWILEAKAVLTKVSCL